MLARVVNRVVYCCVVLYSCSVVLYRVVSCWFALLRVEFFRLDLQKQPSGGAPENRCYFINKKTLKKF